MSLRFTETNKWKDDWYLSLSNDYRIIWQYLLDNCSIAGLWQRGFKHLNYFCGTSVTEPEFFEVFKGRCFELENANFIFIPKFLKVQYPKGLASNKPLILSVLKEIERYNLKPIIKQSLPNYYTTITQSLPNDVRKKVRGKGKGENGKMEEGKEEKGKGCEEIVLPFDSENFRSAWAAWKEYKRSDKKFSYKSPLSEQIALKRLSEISGNIEIKALEIIETSIANGWQGLFEIKTKKNGQQQHPLGHLSKEYLSSVIERSGTGKDGLSGI